MAYSSDLKRAELEFRAAFLRTNPFYAQLESEWIDSLGRLVFALLDSGQFDRLRFNLISSFLRSASASLNLVLSGHLIEAVTLLRKQVELIARLIELETIPFEQLSGRTPNVGGISLALRRFYGSYSSAAHSAKSTDMSLLGYSRSSTKIEHPAFPEFTDNACIIASHWAGIYSEFVTWASNRTHTAPRPKTELAECFGHFSAYLRSGEPERLQSQAEVYALSREREPTTGNPEQDFANCVLRLDSYLVAYRRGMREMYHALASELERLLCTDAVGASALLPRARPDIWLHALRYHDMPPELRKAVFMVIPGRIGQGPFELLFASPSVRKSVPEWVSQIAFSESITVEVAIRAAARSGGEGANSGLDEVLKTLHQNRWAGRPCYEDYMAAIATYLLAHLKTL